MLRTWSVLLDRRKRTVRIDVTSSRAVAQFTGRILDIRILGLLVRPGLVVIAVAPGTVRLERRESPGNNFGIALMAFGTGEVAPVVERLVGQSGMAVVRWCPRVRVMAQTTVLGRIEVPRILAGCRRAVVAGGARAKHLVVVHGCHRFPNVGVMTVLANVRRLNVRWAFARRIGAVVTADAVVHDTGVVEVGGYPRDRRMAVVTVVAAGDVRRVLARRRDTVVARATGAKNLCVVHVEYRNPHV